MVLGSLDSKKYLPYNKLMEIESVVSSVVTGMHPYASYKPVPPSVYCPHLSKQVLGKNPSFFINALAFSFFFPFMRATNPLVL